MNLQPQASSSTLSKLDPSQAAHTLAELLSQTPEYCTFIEALKAINGDLTIQKLSAEMRAHQTALKWGSGDDSQHISEMTRLELELEDLPIMKAYLDAEGNVRALFRAVDELISNETGLAFALNAQHASCSCGG